jgi:uncharacterized protein
MQIIEFISQPWHWSVSGVMLAVVVFLLLYAGGRFGLSSSFDTLCTLAGAGRRISYFRTDWKDHAWLLATIAGSILGGYLASTVFQSPQPVQISADTVESLYQLGVTVPQTKAEGMGFLPLEIFNFNNLLTVQGVIFMIIGGFFIGFGTRYAGGCTSGHAISGLAFLQFGSLIAVFGFFIGGLLMTHLLFPWLLAN